MGAQQVIQPTERGWLDMHDAYPPENLEHEAYRRLRALTDEGWVYEGSYDKGFADLIGVKSDDEVVREHLYNVDIPYLDHPRYFVNRRTGEQMMSIQPYFPCFADRMGQLPADLIFLGKYYPEKIRKDGITIGFGWHKNEETFTQALVERLKEIKKKCENFACQFGLIVEVSFEKSWYYPGETIWIAWRGGLR
jgi:hypothetical protein